MQSQDERIKAILRSEGYSDDELENGVLDLSFHLHFVDTRRELEERARSRVPAWVAEGLMTEEQAAAMSPKELRAFLSGQNALQAYEKDHKKPDAAGSIATPIARSEMRRDEVLSLVGEVVAVLVAIDEGREGARGMIRSLERRLERMSTNR